MLLKFFLLSIKMNNFTSSTRIVHIYLCIVSPLWRIRQWWTGSVTAAPRPWPVLCRVEKPGWGRARFVRRCRLEDESSCIPRSACHEASVCISLMFFNHFILSIVLIRLSKHWHVECVCVCDFLLGANSVFSPSLLAKSLTPRLMKSRKRFESLSVGSAQSCLLPSSGSENCVSPLWEDEQVTPALHPRFIDVPYYSAMLMWMNYNEWKKNIV